MLTWLLNAVSGGLLDKVFGFAEKGLSTISSIDRTKITAATQVTLGQQQVDIALAGDAKELALADKGWWLTAAMKPVAFYTFMAHVIAVVADRTLKLQLGVPMLPAPYDAMEANVIYICLGIAGAYGVSRIVKKA